MKKTKLNLKLLRKVRDRIAEIPESYDQQTYARRDDRAPCGTVACLAGEAIICDSTTVKAGVRRLFRVKDHPYKDIINYAAELLGIEYADAYKMFDWTSPDILDEHEKSVKWPEPYATRFTKAKRPETRARVAVAYLDECLRRKAVTW